MKTAHRLLWAAAPLFPLLAACSADTSRSADQPEAHQALADAPMENFRQVRDGIYRGGHPNTDGVQYLKSLGIQTIVDLEIGDWVETNPADIEREDRDAQAAGITIHHFPVTAFDPGVSDEFDQKITGALAVIQDQSRAPIYVHCTHGQDRTGLVIGLERVFQEGWQPQAAHDEMLQLGFHMEFVGLNHYFEEKTHWED